MKVSNTYQKTKQTWNKHYLREKSFLDYPDENFVRIFSKINISPNTSVLDLGAGSGRHSFYMKEMGFKVFSADVSENSISMIENQKRGIKTFLIENFPYPFESNFFDLVVCWGVLHYNNFEDTLSMMSELQRVMKKDGYIIGSIRSDQDTYLDIKNEQIHLDDLKGGFASLYSLEELQNLLKNFSEVQIGHTERTPLGSLDKKISHWIFRAKL